MRITLGATIAAAALLLTACADDQAGTGAFAPGGEGQGDAPDAPSASSTPDEPADPLTAHHERVRGTDPCAMAESDEYLKQFGSIQDTLTAPNIYQCIARSGDENADVYLFYLTIDEYWDGAEALNPEPTEVDGREAVKTSAPSDDSLDSSCTINVPYLDVPERAAKVRGAKVPAEGGDATWPEACDVTKEYFATILPKLDAMKPNPNPEPGDIIGHDPCARKDEIVALFPGWTATEPEYNGAYSCNVDLTQEGSGYTHEVEIYFGLNERQATTSGGNTVSSEEIEFEGYEGIKTASDATILTDCGNLLITKPSSNPQENDYHLLSVNLMTVAVTDYEAGEQPENAPETDCGLTDEITREVLTGIGG
ncbi:hypothetical protein BAY61_07830 [Prauserella marina]|nr:hypothetical protein [Prauserella marina]ASR34904.1 hypothetical protein BAY61_07830 [Prauserella marina]